MERCGRNVAFCSRAVQHVNAIYHRYYHRYYHRCFQVLRVHKRDHYLENIHTLSPRAYNRWKEFTDEREDIDAFTIGYAEVFPPGYVFLARCTAKARMMCRCLTYIVYSEATNATNSCTTDDSLYAIVCDFNAANTANMTIFGDTRHSSSSERTNFQETAGISSVEGLKVRRHSMNCNGWSRGLIFQQNVLKIQLNILLKYFY